MLPVFDRSATIRRPAVKFDRNEWAGAFGDIGTDLPLIIGMIAAAGLDAASALIMFGIMQIMTALLYRMPMPVQPLKAMAAIVITQKLSGTILAGGGLAVGLLMLLLTVTGLIDWIARIVPKVVIRGMQLGLGFQLATLALKDYVQADAVAGYVLAAAAFILTIALLGNRKYPAALFVILLGAAYAFVFKLHPADVLSSIGFRLPEWHIPGVHDIAVGFVLLALPQVPLSLGNSVLGTKQVAQDLFPDRPLAVRKIGFTYSAMNLVNPFFGGIPTCHGSGGMVGHYAFGARTGGSVVIYGSMYLILGLFFSSGFGQIVQVFPKPVLGVLLLFEALFLMGLVRDIANTKTDWFVAALVGLVCCLLPYGYLIGLIVGPAVAYSVRSRGLDVGR